MVLKMILNLYFGKKKTIFLQKYKGNIRFKKLKIQIKVFQNIKIRYFLQKRRLYFVKKALIKLRKSLLTVKINGIIIHKKTFLV